MRAVGLTCFLFLFWLALSGHYTAMLIALGAISTLLGLGIAARLRIIDAEAVPVQLLRGALTYFPWLTVEIIKSAWAVTKIVLDPRLPISPTMTTVKPSQRSAAGIATYANSITLTPGTLTVEADDSRFVVHALTRSAAIDLERGGMDRRVSEFEGRA